jgi:hypothetical protein
MTTIHSSRLDEALAYLRSRNIYLLDPGNRFRYTPAEHTDVRKTFEDEFLCLRAERDAEVTHA